MSCSQAPLLKENTQEEVKDKKGLNTSGIPNIKDYRGKKVLLAPIEGEEEAAEILEVALVNGVLQEGSFILIPKPKRDQARKQQAALLKPSELWEQIAQDLGADVLLKIKILSFDAKTYDGFSSVTEKDPQLALENGGDGQTQRIYRVRSLKGTVRVCFELMTISKLGGAAMSSMSKITEASDEKQADEKVGSIQLPPKLSFLIKLSEQAVQNFLNPK